MHACGKNTGMHHSHTVISPLIRCIVFNDSFITDQFNILYKQSVSDPDHRIEPVYTCQKPSKQSYSRIQITDMHSFMINDVLSVILVQTTWQIDIRMNQAHHKWCSDLIGNHDSILQYHCRTKTLFHTDILYQSIYSKSDHTCKPYRRNNIHNRYAGRLRTATSRYRIFLQLTETGSPCNSLLLKAKRIRCLKTEGTDQSECHYCP